MTKKELLYKRIEDHGNNLLALFEDATIKDPVKLCKALFRLENKAHRAAENWCNGVQAPGPDSVDYEYWDRQGELLALKARAILGVTGTDSPFTFFFNGDARGYALKVSLKEELGFIPIYRDMGGYGIIAPDFRE